MIQKIIILSYIKNTLKIKKLGFLDTIAFFQELVENLIKEEKISPNTKIVARIKDIESALMNDPTVIINDSLMENLLKSIGEELKKEGKKLDDSFGITIITESEKDKDTILDNINSNIAIHRSKKDTEPNPLDRQYKALHSYLWVDSKKDEEFSPIVECKLMLKEDYDGAYDHTLYKVEHLIGRKLTEEEKLKVIEFIQRYYNEGKFESKKNVPRMWESTYNVKEEKMQRRELSLNEALKTVYTFLQIDTSRSLDD